MNTLQLADYLVFFLYFILVAAYGIWIYKRKTAKNETAQEFFLAEGSLTWWAIGASLIASNISAEHFIGMSGSGFAIGLAISSYEWMSGLVLIIVALFFIPMFLKNRIYTMPQFLATRYNEQVSSIMALFWLLVYVFVNLTSIIYLGALAITSIANISFMTCVVSLSLFSIIVTIGGMRVIGYTDVIQVAVLILGGLVTTYLSLTLLSEEFGFGKDFMAGLSILKQEAPGHFHLILEKGHPHYDKLPGLGVIFGGMLINNLAYWGCNQYIVQRALGADLATARNGILFAAFLKLLVPLIVVIPGIAMFVLHENGLFQNEMSMDGVIKPDQAYPTLMNLLPSGLKGVAFAALTAAVVASLAGKANSISTIFSLDIYKKMINTNASEKQLVNTGRWAVVISITVAAFVAPALRSLDQAYQFIQEYVGFLSPGVLAIFLLGLFWKKTTSGAALFGTILTIPLSATLKFLPDWTGGMFPVYPFLDRMFITFWIVLFLMIIISLMTPSSVKRKEILPFEKSMLEVKPAFIIGSILILGILAALYTVYY
ncbi:MAG: sodium/solute symporter [Saprospiraceae bacterium]|jgi:SSS family solute:Na+ symporter|nr:sodium/solute symporter [Saprospiraceae bacterium]MDP4698542.1 sodium/solute symporter [Saprospiraceae bacterium]MDP4814310.1 sodium/solute symporter [Saprospiraceae bacterium]MDP4914303.1 sodium/solute symporter [Saprospiraceae bacterium]MDP5049634.1 sodium/solute symporter [Saprospiraceae bacterium]